MPATRKLTVVGGVVFGEFDVTAQECRRMYPEFADQIMKGWTIGEPTDTGRLTYWAVPIKEARRAWPELLSEIERTEP